MDDQSRSDHERNPIMTAQSAYQRNLAETTRRIAADNLDDTARSITRFLAPDNDDFLTDPAIRADESVQMILGEWVEEIQAAVRYLRNQRRCIRCLAVLPMEEIRDGYCNKH